MPPPSSRFPGIGAACNSVALLIWEHFLHKNKGSKVQPLPYEWEVKKNALSSLQKYAQTFSLPSLTLQARLQSNRQSQAVIPAMEVDSWSAAQGWGPEVIFVVDLTVTRIWKSPNEHMR